MTTSIRIGNQAKRFREKSGLNQTQVANFLGVDQSYISKCEKGERQFSVDILEKLCSLFGCELSDFDGEDMPVETLNFAFRADAIEEDDLVAISEINKIALNIRQMRQLLGE